MRKYIKYGIWLLLPVFLLLGCGGPQEALPAESTVIQTEAEPVPLADIPAQTAAAETAVPETRPVPVIPAAQAPGTQTACCDDAVIDYSNAAGGYVMVRYGSAAENRLKVQVKGPTATYTYDLPPQEWVVLPLSDGNGSYQVGIYENIGGTRYAKVLTASFQVSLTDEFAPFLRPNRYVNYDADSDAVAVGLEVTVGLEAPLDKVAAVYEFVIGTLSYDFDKAASVQSGYIPDPDRILAEKKGICFDYAALMTAMLRSQQIPCKLVVGYAGSTYHAWISVWTEETGWIDGFLFFDGHSWQRMDPTFASSAGGDEAILNFIKNGTYTEKYLY